MSGDDNELVFASRSRMRLVFPYQLRINLHGAYILMPQHLLDCVNIRAVFQQVRREGMAEGVGRDILMALFGKTLLTCSVLQDKLLDQSIVLREFRSQGVPFAYFI